MIAFAPWQALLDGLGTILAWIYGVVGNFGLSIIVLTILIRLVLLPLGIKQIKSMQHMQAIQPQIKALQKKYKGNKQKVQEETLKLYQEAGVSPLGGCLPLLLQFPILIAMYSVLRAPAPNAEFVSVERTPDVPAFVNNHYPVDSELYRDVTSHDGSSGLSFLFMDLQCSLVQAGEEQPVLDSEGEETEQVLNCGDDTIVDKIPYALLLLLMIGTTFFQQRQMQKASPPGAQSAQQQAIMKYLPLMFAFFGLTFPAGLVLYWTTSNGVQIAQQAFLLRAGHIGPDAIEKRLAEQRARAASGEPGKKGLMARMMERAEAAQDQQRKERPASGGGASSAGTAKGGSSSARPAKGSASRAKGQNRGKKGGGGRG